MPGPQGFPNIAPYDTKALIAMLTSLSRNKSAEDMQARRLLFQGISDIGGGLGQHAQRKDAKYEKAADRIHATQSQRTRQEGYDRRAKTGAKDAAANAAAKAAAAQAKALDRARENLAKAQDEVQAKPVEYPGGVSNKVNYWQEQVRKLSAGPAERGGEAPAEQESNFDPTALDKPAASAAPAPTDPRAGQMHSAQDSAIADMLAQFTPQQDPLNVGTMQGVPPLSGPPPTPTGLPPVGPPPPGTAPMTGQGFLPRVETPPQPTTVQRQVEKLRPPYQAESRPLRPQMGVEKAVEDGILAGDPSAAPLSAGQRRGDMIRMKANQLARTGVPFNEAVRQATAEVEGRVPDLGAGMRSVGDVGASMSPDQQHGAAVAKGGAEFSKRQGLAAQQAKAAAEQSPVRTTRPDAPAPSAPRGPARLPKRHQTFQKPLSGTATSFQIRRVFKEDPNARKLNTDARPTTEVGAVWKAAGEMVTERGMTPEQATDKVMELLGDEAWVKKNLPSLGYTAVERDGKTFLKPKRAVVSSTPFRLVNDGSKGFGSAAAEKARRVLKDAGVDVPLPPGIATPHILNTETGEIYPLSPTPGGSGPSLNELEERIGGSLFRRGAKDPLSAQIITKRLFGGKARSVSSSSGPLTLRAEGHHLARHDPRFSRETILELLKRAAAGQR